MQKQDIHQMAPQVQISLKPYFINKGTAYYRKLHNKIHMSTLTIILKKYRTLLKKKKHNKTVHILITLTGKEYLQEMIFF